MARTTTARTRLHRAPAIALVLLVALGTGTSFAASAPVATLAKKADAICTMENAKRAKNPNRPKFSDPAKATVAQLKGASGYLLRDLAITRDEVSRVFALGTPNEPAAATAWQQLRTLLTAHSIPVFARAAAAAKAGDAKTVVAEFTAGDRYDAPEAKLMKQLGLKVCGH